MEPAFFKSPLLRYYSCYQFKHLDDPSLMIRMHSNKLFLVFLSNDHPIKHENILHVKFEQTTDGLSGKKKRGAPILQAISKIAEVITDKNKYIIRAGVEGKLIEMNEMLLTNPNLLKEPEGYLAILMPPLPKIKGIIERLSQGMSTE